MEVAGQVSLEKSCAPGFALLTSDSLSLEPYRTLAPPSRNSGARYGFSCPLRNDGQVEFRHGMSVRDAHSW
jgi:hypothetical protein